MSASWRLGVAFIRTGAAAVILSALLALTGCAGPGVNPAVSSGNGPGSVLSPASEVVGEVPHQSGSDQPTAAGVGPRGFEFASGFLEFSDFDPYTLGDDIFNPCTEITEQEFAAAGFEQTRYYDTNDPFSNGIASCEFGGPSDDASAGGFYGGQIDRTIAEEHGLILPQFTSASIPELYVIKSKIGMKGICFAQIDTKCGSFGTHFGGPSSRIETDRACIEAIKRAEAMFAVFGTSKH